MINPLCRTCSLNIIRPLRLKVQIGKLRMLATGPRIFGIPYPFSRRQYHGFACNGLQLELARIV
jgi:hypothetical protein